MLNAEFDTAAVLQLIDVRRWAGADVALSNPRHRARKAVNCAFHQEPGCAADVHWSAEVRQTVVRGRPGPCHSQGPVMRPRITDPVVVRTADVTALLFADHTAIRQD